MVVNICVHVSINISQKHLIHNEKQSPKFTLKCFIVFYLMKVFLGNLVIMDFIDNC